MEHMNTEMMVWKPRLLKLTQVANPDVDGGVPTICFVKPDCIERVQRWKVAFGKQGKHGALKDAFHASISCTVITTHGGGTSYVVETPEEVAKMRDHAFGHFDGVKTFPTAIVK